MSESRKPKAESRKPNSTSHQPAPWGAISTLVGRAGAAWRRRRWRKGVRRAGFICVVLTTNLAMLVTQTQAYREINRQINAPDRITLTAGTWAHVSEALAHVARTVGATLQGFFAPYSCATPTYTTRSPAGRPDPWQVAVPAAPFCALNMATGNLLTEAPVVSWQGLGRPISFSLFHNTLGNEPGQTGVLGTKWTHSYSRHFVYNSVGDMYTFYTDEGGSMPFTRVAQDTYAPPTGLHTLLTRDPATGELTLSYKNQDFDLFDADGRLIGLYDASNNEVNVYYVADCSDPNAMHIDYIQDASGNILDLVYSFEDPLVPCVSGTLAQIIAPPIGPPDPPPPGAPTLIDRVYDITADRHIIDRSAYATQQLRRHNRVDH